MGYDGVEDSCEQGSEPSSPTKEENFLTDSVTINCSSKTLYLELFA
jgi:hypothetical protein